MKKTYSSLKQYEKCQIEFVGPHGATFNGELFDVSERVAAAHFDLTGKRIKASDVRNAWYDRVMRKKTPPSTLYKCLWKIS